MTGCEKPEGGVAIEGEEEADEREGMDGENEGADEDAESQCCEGEAVECPRLGGRGEK